MRHTRRDFLRGTIGAATAMSLGPAIPDLFPARATAAAHDARDTILVAIQLTGGNDGLNTVVPYTDDEYGRNRPTLRLPTGELHRIDSQLAFHPRMKGFLRLYQDGWLNIVQGVGSPNPDQDHDRAMRMWHTADPDRPQRQTGWLGRVADNAWNPARPDTTAAFVGSIHRPFVLNAESVVVPSIRSVRRSLQAEPASPKVTASLGYETDRVLLRFLRRNTLNAYASSERVESAMNTAAGSANYPSFGLAESLHTIARLIRADVGIRVFVAELGGGGIGGFDNHANQMGNHCALLHELAESVAAFLHDLKRDNLLDRVLLMTYSEFGRTVKENGRRGTDHGAAAPLFLAGGQVNGGLTGSHPSLTDLSNGALKLQIDFRRVYATVLDRWLGVDSQSILGARFEPFDLLRV
ncbi:MAG: DUF1501 domain-containing protein [Sedimentisphaerales bacterium]|nr:DUF1501 domain-containing protein [Sedimentisphaerales bacterium]